MGSQKWTFEKIRFEAAKFSSRSDFEKWALGA